MRFLALAFTSSVAIASATALLACGMKRLPGPAYTAQPREALVQVPYPPPPARVEYVPRQPDGDAVWIDGEWVWQSRRYAWKPGRWVKPPANAAFAPWTSVRDAMGTLYVAEGTWRDAKGGEVAAPVALRTGASHAGAITSPQGDTLEVAGTQSADASTAKPDGEAPADDTRAPRDLYIDAGDFKVDGSQLPDGGSLEPDDASIIPDAEGFEASFDATPLPSRMKKP